MDGEQELDRLTPKRSLVQSQSGYLRQFLFQGVQDRAELSVHRGGIGLVIDAMQQGPPSPTPTWV